MNEKKPKLTIRDLLYFCLGIMLGMGVMLLWFCSFGVVLLNHLRIENVVIGINETKMIYYVIQTMNTTGG